MALPKGGGADPLVWRIPPWQPALLFLVTSACAAWNIYGHPSGIARGMTIVAGLVCLIVGILWLRMYLVVDFEGIGIRRLTSEQSVGWSEVADIGIVRGRTGNLRLRIERHDSSPVDIPESLLMPAKPTRTPQVAGQLKMIAQQILSYAEPYRRPRP